MTRDDLIAQWLVAKAAEEAAIARRVAIGEKLAALYTVPAEGQITDDATNYKVRLKGVMNRRADWERMDRVYALYQGEPRPEKSKRELDIAGLRWLAENRPEYYLALCDAITATPGRTSIEITPKGEKK